MRPQSSFMVVAPVIPGRTAPLRALLATMNRRPGVVDPANRLVPFGQLDDLHFARFVVIDDQTSGDLRQHGLAPVVDPDSLAFFGDCDGPASEFLARLVRTADAGLRQIFAHCGGPDGTTSLLEWMRRHEHRPAAAYVNWPGRTVRQTREEHRLRAFLEQWQDDHRAERELAPRARHAAMRTAALAEVAAGRLTLSAPEPTPLGWCVRKVLHAVGVPLLFLIVSPLLLVASPVLILVLRRHERTDPEVDLPPTEAHASRLADLEDHGFSNQFTALGTVKPGVFRRWLLTVSLVLLDWAARHIYVRGRLTRVGTIHFARWVFLDGKRRLLFGSNYDGSLESYMDDFINKVGWGLNLVFGNGVGYLRTRFLVLDGAEREQQFKRYIRRHELATEVWYNAHEGLTAVHMDINARIRAGLQQENPTEAQASRWLALFH